MVKWNWGLCDDARAGVILRQRVVAVAQPGRRRGVLARLRLLAGDGHLAAVALDQPVGLGGGQVRLPVVGEPDVRPVQPDRLRGDDQGLVAADDAPGLSQYVVVHQPLAQIGRASCRERV